MAAAAIESLARVAKVSRRMRRLVKLRHLRAESGIRDIEGNTVTSYMLICCESVIRYLTIYNNDDLIYLGLCSEYCT